MTKVILIETCGECGWRRRKRIKLRKKHACFNNWHIEFNESGERPIVDPARLDPDCPLPNLSDIQPFWEDAGDEPDYDKPKG